MCSSDLYGFMPLLDQGLGGGSPKHVRFILKPDDGAGMTHLSGLPLANCHSEDLGLAAGLQVSEAYNLVFSDTDDYYVNLPKTNSRPLRTIVVPRSGVQGILYGNSDDSGGGPDHAFELGNPCW